MMCTKPDWDHREFDERIAEAVQEWNEREGEASEVAADQPHPAAA